MSVNESFGVAIIQKILFLLDARHHLTLVGGQGQAPAQTCRGEGPGDTVKLQLLLVQL